MADPVLSIETAYAEDPETAKLGALLSAWHSRFGDMPRKVAEAIKTAEADQDGQLHAALYEIGGEGGRLNLRRVGRWIERNRERIVEGMRFKDAGTVHRAKRWRVENVSFVSKCEFSSSSREKCQSDKLGREGTANSQNPQNSHPNASRPGYIEGTI